mgnify:CR=1 FL=1
MAKVSGKIFDVQLFSKLLEFVKPYKTTYYFVMIAAILLSVFSTLTPYLLKITVDDYIRLQDYEGMVLMVSLMLGALLMEVLFQFLFVFYANWLGQKVIKDLRVKLFKKILDSIYSIPFNSYVPNPQNGNLEIVFLFRL